MLILYRYYELEGLRNNEWVMKQLGIEEVVNNNPEVKETLESPKVMYKKKTSHIVLLLVRDWLLILHGRCGDHGRTLNNFMRSNTSVLIKWLTYYITW